MENEIKTCLSIIDLFIFLISHQQLWLMAADMSYGMLILFCVFNPVKTSQFRSTANRTLGCVAHYNQLISKLLTDVSLASRVTALVN